MVRVALAVDDRRVDLALPAHRPLGEYLDQVVAMVGPVSGGGSGFRLVRIGGELLPAGRSLAAGGVVDGEVLLLAPGLAAPGRFGDELDDVRAAVTVRVASGASSPALAVTTAAVVLALGTVPLAAVAVTAGRSTVAAAAALLLVLGAGVLDRRRAASAAAVLAIASLVAGAATGAIVAGSVHGLSWWVAAAVGVGTCALGAAVAVPARAGAWVPAAVAAWALAGAGAALHIVADDALVAAPILLAGLAAVDLAPRLGFRMLRPARTEHQTLTGAALDGRLRRARVVARAVEVGGATALVVAGGALALADDGWGWWLAAFAGVVLALHTARADDDVAVVALAAGALGVASELALAVAGPEAGWSSAAAVVTVATVGLAALVAGAPRLRPLARRRLTRIELLLVIPTAALAVATTGLLDALYDVGSRLA